MSDTDNRDPRLDAAYRATPREEPPAELDERIRAAARRAPSAGPQSVDATAQARAQRSWVVRWRVPVSLAATVVIVVTLTVMMQDEERRRAQLEAQVNGAPPAAEAPKRAAPAGEAARIGERTESPRAQPFKPPPPEERRAPAETQAPAPASQAAGKLESPAASGALSKERENRQADTAAAVPPPAPAEQAAPSPAAPASATPSEVTIQTAPAPPPPPEAAARAPAPLSAPAPQAKPAAPPPPPPAMRSVPSREDAEALTRDRSVADRPGRMERGAAPAAAEAKARTPEAWLEEIRRLKAQGRDAEAAAELAEFRKRHPDFALPPDLAK